MSARLGNIGPAGALTVPISVANGGTGATSAGATAANNIGALAIASNLSDVASAATSFGNIKQAATTTATGVVERSTVAETIAGVATTFPAVLDLANSGSLRMGLIAYGTGLNMALDTDQALTFVATPTLWVPTNIIARRVTGAFDTACLGGIYTAASKAGTAIVAAGQSYANLTGAGKIVTATLAAVNGTDVNTSTTLFLSLSTGNSIALTADFYVFGLLLG